MMDECIHGIHRNWCAICKGLVEDLSQRNDDQDRFVENLEKRFRRDNSKDHNQ